MNEREDNLQKIKQIITQYEAEVPGSRRAWPKSIREPALELIRSGMSAKAVADATGLAYFTVLNWKKRSGEFKAVAVARPATVAVPTRNHLAATVTVTNGKLKIEGLTFEQALVAMQRFR